MRDSYSIKQIQNLLENYHELNRGELPSGDWPKVLAGRRGYTSNFEMSALLLADIDYAIQHLPRLLELVILITYIWRQGSAMAGYWTRRSHKEVILIESDAIRMMADILNGKPYYARDMGGRFKTVTVT